MILWLLLTNYGTAIDGTIVGKMIREVLSRDGCGRGVEFDKEGSGIGCFVVGGGWFGGSHFGNITLLDLVDTHGEQNLLCCNGYTISSYDVFLAVWVVVVLTKIIRPWLLCSNKNSNTIFYFVL